MPTAKRETGCPMSASRSSWKRASGGGVIFIRTGAGDAVGTSGIWLWNSPLEYATMTFHSPIALGFSWVSDGSSMAQGLNGVVMVQNIPVVVKKPAFDVNMEEWVTVKIEWAKDADGQQRVDFWINDQSIGGDSSADPD